MGSCKVYIGNLGQEVDKDAIEQEFSKFGLIKDVWIARNPPGFAFIVYNDPRDAEEAVRAMDNKRLCSSKIKVELSHTSDSRRNDRGGRGRGRPRSDRDRDGPIRTSMRDRSPPRLQFSRAAQYDESPSHRHSRASPRDAPTRGPSMHGPPRPAVRRRSEEIFDRGAPYTDRDRYQEPPPTRDRFSYDRGSRYESDYDGFRSNGYRGDHQQPQNGYDRYSDRYADRYEDRYNQPQPPERFREPVSSRAPPRSMDRGADRFPDRRAERVMNHAPDRFGERFPRRSPPLRGPPKTGRMIPRSPPPRRGGRSPIARNWGRNRSPIR